MVGSHPISPYSLSFSQLGQRAAFTASYNHSHCDYLRYYISLYILHYIIFWKKKQGQGIFPEKTQRIKEKSPRSKRERQYTIISLFFSFSFSFSFFFSFSFSFSFSLAFLGFEKNHPVFKITLRFLQKTKLRVSSCRCFLSLFVLFAENCGIAAGFYWEICHFRRVASVDSSAKTSYNLHN